jgi:predicted Zn-dependent peptidase
MTAYHFECAGGFEDNLRELLSFVSVPYFTDESVEKERGIISQEIRMGEDSPGNVVYYNLMKALYAENPVRDSVAGTVESIADITSETLYACHKIFYNPSNMVLCVAGNVDPQRVVDIAREVLPAEPGEVPQRDYGSAETQKVYAPVTRVAMEVSAPQFLFGCRLDPAAKGEAQARERVIGEVAMKYLMGKPSPLYTRLYAEGLIKSDFGASIDYSAGSAVVLAGGESRDPEAVLEAVKAQVEQVREKGIDEALFTRIKNSLYGDNIRLLGSFSDVCTEQAEDFFAGFNLPDSFEILASLTSDELGEFIVRALTPDGWAMSVIDPPQK